MRLRPGRPDLARHSHRFSVPVAESGAPLTVTWLGVTTLLIDDGSSALMTDGFFSRPSLARVGLGKVSPSAARVDGCLARVNVSRLAAVIPVHTHFDHALDSALVADRTGAPLLGGESAANIGRGYGLDEQRLVIAESGASIRLGDFDITLIESHHSPPDRFPGHDHRAGGAAGESSGLPVRRGLVGFRASPAVGSATAHPGQRRVRQRLADRAAR